VNLSVAGRHNVYNALFVIAAALELKMNFGEIATGLSRFKGTKRRLELLGYKGGCAVFSDYAHHPKEIVFTIQSMRECGYKYITAVFEPHTYTRTKSFCLEFAEALSKADEIVLLPVFAAREEYIEGGDSLAVEKLLKGRKIKVENFSDYSSAEKYLDKNLREGGVVLFMGAGTIDAMAREFMKNYKLQSTNYK
jgi:UDP-N-acetylmuramate--alanine ligase